MYYEVKAKYPEEQGNGERKAVNRSFLFDAESFAEAETRMHEFAESEGLRDYVIKAISPSKINLVIDHFKEDDGKFFNVTATYFEESDNGKKKNYHRYYLVKGKVPEDVVPFVEEDWCESTFEWSITMIKESPIVQVIEYEEKEVGE